MPAIHFDITGDNKEVLQALEQTNRAITNLQKTSGQASKAVEEDMSDMGQSAAASAGKVGSSLSSMAVRFVSLTAVITALGKVIGNAITVNKQFERKNSELASVLGVTKKEVKELSDAAEDLGRKTEFTSSEVTELQVALARLGFTTPQIKDMEGAVLKFAGAVNTDLGRAANFAGAALRGFGLEAKDTTHLLDVMAASTSKSALDFSKLETSMSIVAPIAHAFGLSVEDAVTLLGALSNAGFDASSAATATRNILLNLADANGKLAKGLGHTARTFDEIIASLKECKKRGVDLNSTLEMTDKRSVSAFNALISGAASADELRTALGNVDGTLDKMYDTMRDNLQGAVNELKSAWEGLLLTFADEGGILQKTIKKLTDLINKLTDVQNAINTGGKRPGDKKEEKALLDRFLGIGKESGTEEMRRQFLAWEKSAQAEYDRAVDRYNAHKTRKNKKAMYEVGRTFLNLTDIRSQILGFNEGEPQPAPKKDDGGGNKTPTLSEEQKKAMEKAREAYTKMVKELWKSVANSSIEAMKEGTKKVLAQIDNEEKQALAAIDDELTKLEETAKKAGKKVSQETYAQFDARRRNVRVTAQNRRDDVFDQQMENRWDYLIEYGSFREKELAIKQKYDQMILKSDDEFVKKKLRKERQKELAELEMSENSVYRSIFADADTMTRDVLDNTIEYANALLQAKINAGANVEEIKALRDQIDKLRDARDELDFSGWGGTLQGVVMAARKRNKANEDLSQYHAERAKNMNTLDRLSYMDSDAWRDLSRRISEATTASKKWDAEMKKQAAALAATQLGDLLGKIGSAMAEVAEISGSDSLSHAAEGFSEIGGVVSNIAQGFATGGLWGGIASAVSTFATKIIEAFESVAVADAKYDKFIKDFERGLTLLKLEVNDIDFTNAFGVDEYGKFVEAFGKMAVAMDEFSDASKRLSSMNVKTKDFSWWSNVWGKDDEYSRLGAFDIWDDKGLLDVGKAQAFLNASTTLTEQQREEIENAIALRNAYDELVSITRDFVSSLTGNVLNTLAEDMLENFLNTGSAIVDATKYLNDFNKALATSVIKSMLMKEVFTDEAQGKIVEALANRDTSGAIDLYNELLQRANEMAPQIEEFLRGAGVSDLTAQTATAGGFQSMNYDQANELNGRFAAVQLAIDNILKDLDLSVEYLLSIRGIAEGGVGKLSEIRDLHIAEVGYLEDIAKQTKPLLSLDEKLDKIEKNTSKL